MRLFTCLALSKAVAKAKGLLDVDEEEDDDADLGAEADENSLILHGRSAEKWSPSRIKPQSQSQHRSIAG